MKMFKTVSVFILLFTGSLLNAQSETTDSRDSPLHSWNGGSTPRNTTPSPAREDYHVPGRSLPTLVVAGVSIALVLLFILIVAIFWYGWRKSQEGSIEINPIPYGEAGVSLRTVSVSEN